MKRQPWLHSRGLDSVFILAPAFLATIVVILFADFFQASNATSPLMWLLLIVFVDVAHVYSTLYRTYFDREEFRRYRKPLILIPLLAWIVGFALYRVDGMLFWRVLAYLAVYHFVRQQYGFFSIYARKSERPLWERRLDAAAIYMSTIYPLIYWHTHLPRNFFWFVPGDFVGIGWEMLHWIGACFFLSVLFSYCVKEFLRTKRLHFFNWPKNLLLLGTALSWNVGIVFMNGDLAFTATNVLAHGIPYMALIWVYGQKKSGKSEQNWLSLVFSRGMIPVFVGFLILLAYLEEGLWDAMVWRDHEGLFPWANDLPFFEEGNIWLALIVPLLAVPQITHYVIDGFIWRVRKPGSVAEQEVFGGEVR